MAGPGRTTRPKSFDKTTINMLEKYHLERMTGTGKKCAPDI